MTTDAPATPQALAGDTSVSTLVDHFHRQLRTRPGDVAMWFRGGERWVPVTWDHFGRAARRLAAVLIEEGVQPGDHVAIWARNRPEWHIADAAILSVRARPVPVYPTSSPEQVEYVLGHSGALVAIVETAAQLQPLLAARDRLATLRRIIVMEGLSEASGDGLVIPWASALADEESLSHRHGSEIDQRVRESNPDDVATLIYTSGTTGPPKAVMITHRNIAAEIASINAIIAAGPDDRVVSYLPLAHIAERVQSEFRQYVFGNPVWFISSFERLREELTEVRPTLFFAVPRVWEKMAAAITGRLDAARGFRGRLGRWAVGVGSSVAHAREQGRTPGLFLMIRHRVADRLVLAKVRAALGLDAATVLCSGAAPIGADVLRLFASLGMPILEAYGQTEDSGAVTMTRPGRPRIGTVGPPLPGVELRIADDGEVLVRGPFVFAGYHRDPEATAQALDADGWLHTGDVGVLEPDGCLRITDRKKDLIITAGGKNIAPSVIEAALKRDRIIGNAVVIGDRRPYVTALLTLDAIEVVDWARQQGIAETDPAALATNERVLEHVTVAVTAVNATLSQVEQVKRWRILDHDFEVGVELTPTLKVRRRVVEELHGAVIEQNYSVTDAPGVSSKG